MIDSLKPYPLMKDSGIPWLGRIPDHWGLVRLGALVRERGETNKKSSVTDVLSVTRNRGVIPYAEKGNIGNKKSEDITRYKIVRPHDIVVNCMNVIIGSVGISEYTGCLSPIYYVLTTRDLEKNNPHYLNAYFQTKPFQESLVRIGNGILAHRMRIPMELLKCELFPVPPRDEQDAIVRLLDYVDRRIRSYIRAKQKIIKLLEEQQQAIIHRAVTRGYIPQVCLKPSGVGWLDDIPQGWEMVQLRRLVGRGRKITYGIVQPGEPDASGRYMVRGQDYSVGWARPETIFRVSDAIETPYQRSRLAAGDLVVTIVGAGVGNVARVPHWLDGANITQTTARVSIAPKKADPEYVAYALKSPIGRRNVEFFVKGAAQPGLNLEHLRVFQIPLPPLHEQSSIVCAIQREVDKLAALIGRARQEITRLRELHASLFAFVVTGKSDVRALSEQLPRETNEVVMASETQDLTEKDEGAIDDGGVEATEEAEA